MLVVKVLSITEKQVFYEYVESGKVDSLQVTKRCKLPQVGDLFRSATALAAYML